MAEQRCKQDHSVDGSLGPCGKVATFYLPTALNRPFGEVTFLCPWHARWAAEAGIFVLPLPSDVQE